MTCKETFDLHESAEDPMDNDDLPVGRRLTRREAVELFGASAVSLFFARRLSATALRAPGDGANTLIRLHELACIVRPEMTEGPYFVDHQLNRADIRSEPVSGVLSAGVPLTIAFNIASVGNGACAPLADATIDVWQCDADGVYSGVNDRMTGHNTTDKKYLRGFQKTDANGQTKFTTIYPGWYQGRAVHLHLKIRTIGADKNAYEFTSQLFFDDALSDAIFASAPYKQGTRDTRNANDGIYRNGGKEMTLALAKSANGYASVISIGLDLTNAAVGRTDGMGAGGRGRGRGGRGRG